MSRKSKAVEVCIVGAGVAGLAIAKQLQESGIKFRCYDARDRIGGIWTQTDDPKHTAAWTRLNQNTPKGRYEFSDFPMPESYPDFPTREQIQNYLENYAIHFKFLSKISFNTKVISADRQANGGWEVKTSDNQTHYFDYFIVANGHHNKPHYPPYFKDNNFAGSSIHSGQYRDRDEFKGKNVMVVGIGNSGSQIAVDVSHSAEQTFISTRRGVYILPHYVAGFRVDNVFGFYEWWWVHKILPWPVLHWTSSLIYKLFLAKNQKFGLPVPKHLMLEDLPTVSENFFNRIGDGRLTVKPEVERIDGDTVYFKDGSNEVLDAIIYSTGFNLDFPFFNDDSLQFKDNCVPLYKRIFLPENPDLCFIGLFQAVTYGFLHIMEDQAKLAAKYIEGKYKLPSSEIMQKDIESERRQIAKKFIKSLRNNYQMMGSVYLRDIQVELRKGIKRANKLQGTGDCQYQERAYED